MHFHLSGFMVVDLPRSGNECLPADENDLLVLEVEALRQEPGEEAEHQSKEFNSFHFYKGFKGLKIFRFITNRR